MPIQTKNFSSEAIAGIKSRLLALSFEQREALNLALLEAVTKADKSGAVLNSMEKSLTRYTMKMWKPVANKAVDDALAIISNSKLPFKKSHANAIYKSLSNNFSGFEDTVADRWKSETEAFYKLNLNRFKQRITKKGTTVSKSSLVKIKKDVYSDMDVKTWEKISNLSVMSVAERFPRDLLPAIKKAIEVGILEKDLNLEQATEYLMRELTVILGATNQAVAKELITAGLDRSANYWKGLSTTNMSFARNFGQVNVMESVDVKDYVIVAIMDNLTSVICQLMDGKTFSIESAIKHRDAILEAETLDDVKNIAPWRKDLSGVGKGKEDLSGAGMALPPYHFRCRTEVYPA